MNGSPVRDHLEQRQQRITTGLRLRRMFTDRRTLMLGVRSAPLRQAGYDMTSAGQAYAVADIDGVLHLAGRAAR